MCQQKYNPNSDSIGAPMLMQDLNLRHIAKLVPFNKTTKSNASTPIFINIS
jgi:hypothetical protein